MISRRSMLQSLAAAAVLGAAPKRPVIGFATGTYGMKTLSTQEALRAIAEIGFDGVEPCLITGWPADPAKLSAPDRRALRSVLGETGLAVPALLESLSITGVAAKRASNLERLKLAVDIGNELVPSTPPVIDTIIGGKTADWEKLKGTMADELHAWARVAEDAKTYHLLQASRSAGGEQSGAGHLALAGSREPRSAPSMITATSSWRGFLWRRASSNYCPTRHLSP